MEWLKKLAKLLGLPETAGEQEIEQAVAKLKESTPKPVIAKEILAALELSETSGQSEVVATIHALKQRPDYSQEIAALKAKLAARERDELVAAALKDGKITAAQKEWAEAYALSDPEGFKLFAAKAPQVVPLDQLDLVPDPKSKKGEVPDDVQLEINRMCGLNDETWKKYNP